MKNNTLESLPNEILLIIFNYLTSFDLCRAFIDVRNARFERLLACIHHSLNVSSIRCEQMRRFLARSNGDTASRFATLINTVVLDDSLPCRMLIEHWTKTLDDTESLNVCLPSIKRLIVKADYYEYHLVEPLLLPLVSGRNTLQYLHLVFERPTYTYPTILSQLVLHRISVQTMILEVEKGM
jgi:hypothetical protein